MMKRIVSIMLAILMTASAMLAGCTPAEKPAESTPNETPAKTPAESTPEETPEPSEPESTPEETPVVDPEPVKSDFEIYPSNIAYGTGHNIMVYGENNQKEFATYRAILHVEEYGEFEYKLFFSNNMDASSQGFSNYPTLPTEDYKIHYAALRTTTDKRGLKGFSEPTVITFGGEKTRDVKAGEMFWSDAVTFNVPEGSFLVYEWTVEYTRIPGTIVASTYYCYKSNTTAENFPKVPGAANGMPMPDLIGCKREGTRLTFIGDSITMGTGSGGFQHAFWVKQISDRLGSDYCVWNLGLDSGRANDVILGTSWKEKLKNTDILCICLGINDVANGIFNAPKSGKAADAASIIGYIRQIAKIAEDAGVEVIIFSVPPFNLTGSTHQKWLDVNNGIKKLTDEKGYGFFDFAAVLGDPDDPAKCIYGDHPNKEGCTAVADAFMASGILESKE